ncbi:MAG: ribonuclease H-like domain-containing protein [Trichodesmium sp. St5_bin8]|nr:ribonuclease H-like domain-containing protein [Trichodesmium sp. St5_bin8]
MSEEIMLDLFHPSPCPSCGKTNENKWCYKMYSNGDVLLACKRDSTQLKRKKNYVDTGSVDAEGTHLYRDIPGRNISPQGNKTCIYYSYSTPKLAIVKVLRKNNGAGEKSFTQYGYVNNQWEIGLKNVDKSDINLYNLEKLNPSHKNTVYLCEGEKVADEVTKTGLLGICNIGGANKWKDVYGKFLSELGVKVVLVPDCDTVGVKSMLKIERELKKLHIKTSWLHPFDGNKMWKNLPENHGLDFADWVEYIKEFDYDKVFIEGLVKKDCINTGSGNNDSSNSNYQKIKILDNLNKIFTQPTICVDGSIYIWSGTHYEFKSEGRVKKIIWDYLENTPVLRHIDGEKKLVLDPQPGEMEKIYTAACSRFFVEPSEMHNGGVNCKNGLLKIDWSDPKNPKPTLLKHDPSQYYTYCSDVVYDENAGTEYLDKLMECLEPRYADIFFQVIGVALDFDKVRKLTGRTVKALLMSGFGSNGKDSLKTVLGLIINNISDVSFQDFKEYDAGRKFPLTKLRHATVNWASENSSVNLANIQSIKSAITGETLSYEKKGKNEETMACNLVNLFNVNALPQINNLDALLTRFAEIRFEKTYSARPKDGELKADPRFRYDFEFLKKEVCPAFLNRMIEGLVKTVKSGIDYTPTDHLIEEMKEKTNHLWSFARETGLKMGDGEVTTMEIWEKLEEWYLDSDILEIDGMGKKIYFGGEKRKDSPVKCPAQVKPRFQEIFPKAKVVSTRSAKKRVTTFKGLIFENNSEKDKNKVETPPPTPPIDNSGGNDKTLLLKSQPEKGQTPSKNLTSGNTKSMAKPPNYPYNLTTLDKQTNTIEVDESQIDIYDTKRLNSDGFTPYKIPDYNDLNILYVDIETTGLDYNFSEIIAIGVSDGKEKWLMTRESKSEQDLLIEFLTLIVEKSKGLIIVGHNIYNFDIPFIFERAKANSINAKIRFANTSSFITSSSVNGKPIEYTGMYWNNVQFVDTYHLLGTFDKSANKLTSYSLKRSVLQLNLRHEERLELGHKEILAEYENGIWENILTYLDYDLEDTKLLCDFLLPQVYYQLKVVPNINLQRLVTASPALKWELILEEHYEEKPEPDPKRKYKGGLVEVNPGYYDSCGKIDVSGMYPSIQLLYGLSSLKDTNNFYLTVLDYLMNERTVLKQKYKETKEAKYNAMQNAYKILNNGGYGFTGTTGYSFNCMQTSALVTAYGRVIVSKMVDEMEKLDCKIIEVDTDGIYFSHPNQKEVYEKIQQILPDGISIDLEHENVSIYCPAKKNYIIFDDDKYTVKGGNFKSRTKCSLLKNFTPNFLLSYKESPTIAENYYNNLVDELKSGNYDLKELTVRQRIPKNSKALLSLGEVGEVIHYYWGGTVTKRGAIKKQPIQTGDYLPEYYVKEVSSLKKSISEVLLN